MTISQSDERQTATDMCTVLRMKDVDKAPMERSHGSSRSVREFGLASRQSLAGIVTLVAVGAMVASLASCSSSSRPTESTESHSSPTSLGSNKTSQTSLGSSKTGTGSGVAASSHFTDACQNARNLGGPFTVGRTDFGFGTFSYSGLRGRASLPSSEAPAHDARSTFYKSGAQLAPNSSATVKIVSPAASKATIGTETGPTNGTRSVTYKNCRSTPQWFVGGIILWGHPSGCVTIEVKTSTNPAPKLGVVSLNAGKCAAVPS